MITDREAWRLFQIAAISEAGSWVLLLIGILIKYVLRPGDDTWVAIGGSIHGTIFIGYAVAVLGLFRILRLSFWQVVLAAVASVVPFGTLAFEQWLGSQRSRMQRESFRQVVVRGVIKKGTNTLAILQSDTNFWCLPGGALQGGETPEHSLLRTITNQTGVVPVIGEGRYVQQYVHRGILRIELLFDVTNVHDFSVEFPLGGQYERTGLDAISFLSADSTVTFKPAFLLEK